MKLIYIDEAGNTGSKADPDQPIHMIGALLVDQTYVRNIEIRLNKLAVECTFQIETTDPVSPDDLEFHGAELYAGKKLFQGVKPASRVQFCTEIINICKEEGALFGACAVNKTKQTHGGHPHLRCFQFMLERVQDHLEKPSVNDLGLIIADEHRELEDRIIKDLAFSKSFNTSWGYRPTTITNVVDTVHFVKSRHNRLIQACDVITYFKLKGYRIWRKQLDAYMALAAPSPASRPTSFDQYCDINVKQAEKAVLTLYNTIRTFELFPEKIWPLS